MSNFASSVCFNMADLFTQDYEDAQNSDEGLGSGSEGMSGDGDGDDELCDDPSSSLEEICQGARLDLLEEHQRSENPYHRCDAVQPLCSGSARNVQQQQQQQKYTVVQPPSFPFVLLLL
ncbi:hypothetical protein B566_EDAN006936 [Ephemera danica]|nr:hypothetical protein B566_EDAN006936 [Ephemera danica]